MCWAAVAAIVPAVMSLASSASGAAGGAGPTKTNARLAFANTAETINKQAAQIDAQQSENIFDNAVKSQQTQSSIVASASDSGVGPSSLAHALNAADFADDRQATLQDINSQNERQQLGDQLTAASRTEFNTIQSVANPLAPLLVFDPVLGLALGANHHG